MKTLYSTRDFFLLIIFDALNTFNTMNERDLTRRPKGSGNPQEKEESGRKERIRLVERR